MCPTNPFDQEEERGALCAACREPVELVDPDDPESWIHSVDANYFGDHTAWVEGEAVERHRGAM